MSKQKPVAIALGTAPAGLTLSGSAFAMQPLAQGYMVAAGEAAKAGEGKCGEGACGVAKADTDKDGRLSQAEFATAHPDKADQFARIDANQDGFIDEAERKAHHAAKGSEGTCGDKKGAEGKCGEGKCGEGKCGAKP
ncbi:EF-hand domain-containing protein [Pseudoxanthomonas sp. NC8]|nr:EF-hand domain-containing protein [Pseudoxanthomonas sp. NC8]